MPKSLTATVIGKIDAEQSQPINLFTLNFSTVLRFCTGKSNVTFPTTGGSVYTAKAVEFDPIQQDNVGNLTRVRVRFDNVSKDMASYANSFDFQGTILNIKRIWRDALTSALNYDELFNGPMESPEIDYYWLSVNARVGHALWTRCPSRIIQRKCPWKFGGTECNRDGNADITGTPMRVTGTADSGTTTTLVDNALTQANDFWNYGLITLTKAGVTESRIVDDFVAGTDTVSWSVPTSFAVDGATTYVLIKGCDKTLATCRGNTAWGPTVDNDANFGGFPSIGRRPVVAGGGNMGSYQPDANYLINGRATEDIRKITTSDVVYRGGYE